MCRLVSALDGSGMASSCCDKRHVALLHQSNNSFSGEWISVSIYGNIILSFPISPDVKDITVFDLNLISRYTKSSHTNDFY